MIDHIPGGHDDIANAIAGVVWRAARPKRKPFEWYVGRAGAGGFFIDGDGNRREVGGFQDEPITEKSPFDIPAFAEPVGAGIRDTPWKRF